MDTGAVTSMLNPTVLPKEQWIPHFQKFNTASKGILTTWVITNNPIIIEFFPGVQFRTKLLGSIIPGTDFIIGFDIYKQLNDQLIVKTQGIAFRDNFKPYTTTTRLFSITEDERVKNINCQLVEESCVDSHSEFMKKHDKPLWINEEFFIRLPFKRNENINPTRASHSGMNPEHLLLAKKECEELLEYGLIEPSHSQWSCEAFYVNKRIEQARGFWQLGIHPEDKSKTGFCITDHHYQWKVNPFGLKPAVSLFQKAMIKIFQQILHTSLVYIDDILLFSDTMEEHFGILHKFHELVKQYGIMLSEKKMILVKNEIDFLGMHFTQGAYIPWPHICKELIKFPDTKFTVKQLQQFHGVLNYVQDFIPDVSTYISPLTKMLTKKSPAWGKDQDHAVHKIKDISKEVKTLHIPPDGLNILQTDASNAYWSAILLEEKDGQRKICGYTSGRIKDAKQHYYSMFKQILAVQNGIKKFNFFLIHIEFLIEMDMRAFPKMIQIPKDHPEPPDPPMGTMVLSL
ncbi:hypothetical protein MTR67_022933 [Solanum verrucosum]|uniref:Reverse transcriptase domain-containing protein n=1 Tax=Solanum verrucosum TaxID=315347 RepID=A0AAF0QUD4_SOLVR|nr:hypothetical protein MTR67_022933 [Solanum verrucosum]